MCARQPIMAVWLVMSVVRVSCTAFFLHHRRERRERTEQAYHSVGRTYKEDGSVVIEGEAQQRDVLLHHYLVLLSMSHLDRAASSLQTGSSYHITILRELFQGFYGNIPAAN